MPSACSDTASTALPDSLNSHQSDHKVDNTGPTIIGLTFTANRPYVTDDVITLRVTFNERVTIGSGTAASIPLTIGSTTRTATAATATVASSTHNFTYTVVAADSDTDGISVATAAVLSNPGRMTDEAGNVMTATALPDGLNSAQARHTVNAPPTRPTVTGLALSSSGPYGLGDVITLQATFSESVTVSSNSTGSIPLQIGSTARAATATGTNTASRSHNFTYTVAAADSDNDGIQVTTAAVFTNPGAISSTSGYSMTATALPDTLNSHQSSHSVDSTRPTVTGLAFTSSGPYKQGDVITLQAVFSESVTIATGTAASIPLTIGSNSRAATAASTRTASSSHNFTYTVVAADNDTDGIAVASAAVLSNPGRLSDGAGNTVTATALPDNLNSAQSNQQVDNTAPTVSAINFAGSGPYKAHDIITLVATFSEAVTISSGTAAGIPLTIGSNSRTATAAASNTARSQP